MRLSPPVPFAILALLPFHPAQAGSSAAPDFGPNVLSFHPKMTSAAIQEAVNKVYALQKDSQFGSARFALLFAPGEYRVDVPVGYCEFPKEILKPPRSLAAKTYTDIRRWTVMKKGGHYAALEEPRELASEISAFFDALT